MRLFANSCPDVTTLVLAAITMVDAREDGRWVVPTDGDDVFVLYEYELGTGERYRNMEVLTVRDDKVVETQVFFGGRVSA